MASVSAAIGGRRAAMRARKAARPARSVSPGSQDAGVLFRGSGAVPEQTQTSGARGQAFVACVVLPSLRGSPAPSPAPSSIASPRRPAGAPAAPVRLRPGAGYGLPPLSRDYGFAYATRPAASLDAAARAASDDEDASLRSHPGSDARPAAHDAYGFRLAAPGEAVLGRPARRVRRPGSAPPRSCMSCGATKTPYWREAWAPGVLLCNACGLRFSKFRRRCGGCAYVPRREDKGSRACTRCASPWC